MKKKKSIALNLIVIDKKEKKRRLLISTLTNDFCLFTLNIEIGKKVEKSEAKKNIY